MPNPILARSSLVQPQLARSGDSKKIRRKLFTTLSCFQKVQKQKVSVSFAKPFVFCNSCFSRVGRASCFVILSLVFCNARHVVTM